MCENLNTDHTPLIELYRKARAIPGVKKVLVASGVRYDLAIESPEYVKELAQHHVGGYLKIAPEHVREGPLSKMMKPGVGTYYRFKELFDRYSKEAGKEQYLIPYFIAAHPGTTDEDMLELAIWLKKNGFRADQVQAFLPSPMALATAMYHSGKNPLRRVTRDSENVVVAKGLRQRRLHKAFLRYHDPNNWPVLREALRRMGRGNLIGSGPRHLIPAYQPPGTGDAAKDVATPPGSVQAEHPRRPQGGAGARGATGAYAAHPYAAHGPAASALARPAAWSARKASDDGVARDGAGRAAHCDRHHGRRARQSRAAQRAGCAAARVTGYGGGLPVVQRIGAAGRGLHDADPAWPGAARRRRGAAAGHPLLQRRHLPDARRCPSFLGYVTPLGGVLLIGAWLWLRYGAVALRPLTL